MYIYIFLYTILNTRCWWIELVCLLHSFGVSPAFIIFCPIRFFSVSLKRRATGSRTGPVLTPLRGREWALNIAIPPFCQCKDISPSSQSWLASLLPQAWAWTSGVVTAERFSGYCSVTHTALVSLTVFQVTLAGKDQKVLSPLPSQWLKGELRTWHRDLASRCATRSRARPLRSGPLCCFLLLVQSSQARFNRFSSVNELELSIKGYKNTANDFSLSCMLSVISGGKLNILIAQKKHQDSTST